MVSIANVDSMLTKVGMVNKYWGRAEVRELCRILTEDEEIIGAVNGRYEGGWALLVATNKRLLLIDKKLWFLGLEDIRYDMIAELDFRGALLDATISIQTINKTLQFRTTRQMRLREMTGLIQQHVMKVRQSAYELWQAHGVSVSKQQPNAGLPLEMPQPIPAITAAQDLEALAFSGASFPRGSLMAKRRVRRFPLTQN